MFVGHYAVGLAAKRFAPRTSLGILMAASILLDLIWAMLVLIGSEHASIIDSPNPFLRLQFDSYPISHGLVAAIGWATLFASIYFGLARYLAGAITVWVGVISHWLLDYVVHLADLPLYAGSQLVGLAWWNRPRMMIAIELVLLAGGVAFYLLRTRAKDKIGSLGFWTFVVVIVALYGAIVFGAVPTSVNKLAIVALCSLLFVSLAWWFDSHRETRYRTANGSERVQDPT